MHVRTHARTHPSWNIIHEESSGVCRPCISSAKPTTCHCLGFRQRRHRGVPGRGGWGLRCFPVAAGRFCQDGWKKRPQLWYTSQRERCSQCKMNELFETRYTRSDTKQRPRLPQFEKESVACRHVPKPDHHSNTTVATISYCHGED